MISFSQTGGTSGITQITISATSTQELADVVNHYTLGNESTSLDMPVVQKAYVPVQKYITISPSAITWSSSNNTGSITINSNDSWVVVSDGWIQVSRMYESDISERYNSVSGNGNTIIGISCFENIGDARIGGITAYCQSNSAISATTTVSQAGGYVKPYITLGTYSMQVSGGSVTTAVTVQSNVSWTATTDSNWVTLNTLTGSGNGNVSFTVSANTSSIERRATITVFNGEINAVLVLTQAASLSRPYIILSPNSFSVPYEGSTGNTISVSANCDYDIEADANWITVNAVSGSGNGSVSFSTSAMTGSSVGNIVFSNSAITEYATVETAFIPYLSANTNRITSTASGGSFVVSVYSNVNWAVSVDMGEGEVQDSWLSVIPSSGSNDGSITISVLSGEDEMSGSVVLSNSLYNLEFTINIEKEGIVRYLSASTNSISTSSGGTFAVSVYSNTNWNASVNEGNYNTPWLSVSPLSGTNNGSINISVLSGEYETSGSVVLSNSSYGLEYVIGVEKEEYIDGTKLYYTTTGNTTITGFVRTGWGATIISNTYKNGQGVITFDNNITSVPSSAFSGNTKLKTIILPNTITSIGSNAFRDCTNLIGDLKIPSSSTTIGSNAFKNCENLSGYLIIPNTVTDIGAYAFDGCKSITGLTIGSGLTEIKTGTFNTNGIQGQLVIPNNITGFGNCFLYCTGITSVVFSTSVTSDGGYTFRGCRSITEIVLPSNITNVGQYCYDGCSGLTSVTLTNIDVIADYAFKGTKNLKEIYSYRRTQPSMILTNPFYKAGENVLQKTFHYPSGSDYSNLISALPSGWTAVADL